MMKLPVLGKIYKNIYVSRFSETLSTLLVGGIPVVEALEISGSATGNFVLKILLVNWRMEFVVVNKSIN